MTLNNIESSPPTRGELAYRALRRMIVECEFAPGSSVSEPELTQLVGEGKAAVRSALLRLSHDGLITAVPRFGYRIAPLDIKDALELTQLRLLTEPTAIRLATGRLEPAVIQLARKRYAAGYDWKSPKAVTRYLNYSREFKLSFAKASGNRRLALWIEDVSEQVDRYLRIGAMSSSELPPIIAAHLLPVCDAMLDGRAEDAEALAAENILAVTARILSALFRPHERASEFAFTSADIASMLAFRRAGAVAGRPPEPRPRKAA